MSEPKEEELYAHLMNFSRVRASVLSFLSGFTFTVIGIFLNQLPNVTNILSQITLLFLTFLFELFLFLLAWQTIIISACAPPRVAHAVAGHFFKTEVRTFGQLMMLGYGLWGFSVMLMFLLWNLFFLAIMASAAWILILVILNNILSNQTKRIIGIVHPEMFKKDSGN